MLKNLKLQARFTLFILAVTLPLLIGALVILSSRANVLIEEQANHDLQVTNTTIVKNTDIWLQLHYRALLETSLLPDVVSMDSARQKPVLETIAQAYPNLYLIHTMDRTGQNVARNDDGELRNYSDRVYFTGAIEGNPITLQTLISRTTGNPALAMSVPIYDGGNRIIGVASFASELGEVSQEVTNVVLGETGYAFLVDESNQVIAHPDASIVQSDELQDFSNNPAIASLRQGNDGLITFTDENNVRWRAYVSQLDNGWGVVVQQTEAELLAPARTLNTISVVVIVLGIIVLAVFSYVVIQRLVKPIQIVTEAATAVSAGELDQVIEIDSQDEIGVLATAFNKMTAQLRELIGSLEQRVVDRTKALETSAEVSRRLAAILDPRQLAGEVVDEVRNAFDYYYAQIYLLDEAGENLVIAGGTGEAGAAMLASGHSVPKGRGLVGRAADVKATVLIPDVSREEGWLPNELLPETKAEAAVPISVGDRVLGVLDVQHNMVNGLTAEDVTLLESLASQVAVTLQNARVYEQTQKQAELESLVNLIGQRIQRTTSVEDTLQTAIRELGTAIGASRVRASLHPAANAAKTEPVAPAEPVLAAEAERKNGSNPSDPESALAE